MVWCKWVVSWGVVKVIKVIGFVVFVVNVVKVIVVRIMNKCIGLIMILSWWVILFFILSICNEWVRFLISGSSINMLYMIGNMWFYFWVCSEFDNYKLVVMVLFKLFLISSKLLSVVNIEFMLILVSISW